MGKYPFLSQAKQYVAGLDINIAELGSLAAVRDRAKERVTSTFELSTYFSQVPSRKCEVEITSFPVAIMLVAGVKDNALTERFALSEARKMYDYLLSEKKELILAITKFFNWDIKEIEQAPYEYTVDFVSYVNNVTRGRLSYASEWKLINRQIHKGQVGVTRKELCRLLQEEIKQYIEVKAKERIPKVTKNIQDLIDDIESEFSKIKPHLTEFDKIAQADESEYPPCIKHLLDRAIKGHHLSHVERFTLVTYLLHQGVGVEGITNMFAKVSDFRKNKTRYQVEHLAGERGSRTAYRTYNCSTLQTHGVCVDPNDSICRTIRNPLTYHSRKKSIKEESH